MFWFAGGTKYTLVTAPLSGRVRSTSNCVTCGISGLQTLPTPSNEVKKGLILLRSVLLKCYGFSILQTMFLDLQRDWSVLLIF